MWYWFQKRDWVPDDKTIGAQLKQAAFPLLTLEQVRLHRQGFALSGQADNLGPWAKLSLQMHHRRAGYWIVASGAA